MAIITSILSWIIKKRMHQIELFMKYPSEVQEEWLRKLILTAQHTQWGEHFGYNSIENARTFKERVPVVSYEQLQPQIERIMRGEQNILWPTEIKWFAKSSGTTGSKSKFIPVSMESLEECHFKGGKDLLSIYLNNNPDAQLFDGKLLSLGGSHSVSAFNSESYYGDISAILIQNLPFWVKIMRTPDISIALMDKWDDKIEKMAQETIKENVTNLSGVPSWTLVLLHKVLELSGKSSIAEVWPNLELFVHGAVNFTPYKEQFHKIIGKPIQYLETYNASEGFFGIQDRNNSDDMLLMLDYGVYYEFVPQSEWDREHPVTLSLDQVKTGEQYAVIITTNAGLWRYKIGDTIQFTSTDPYRIKITGRTAQYINAFGEELMVDNAERAIAEAGKRTGALVREFTAAPVYFNSTKTGAHEWLVEFSNDPTSMDDFAVALDEELKKLNSDYEAKRFKDMTLNKPIVRKLPLNTFYRWMELRKKLGGQHKVPRLANNRDFIEEILTLKNQAL
ncbi:MAG: GH3 auxin-responsive promoter family protein [Bacteroidetes bacterium]|jgi:hypothetical protein|nr:GH3 auxin-responsive promoter family protein [Bacteroidota bacterium]